MDSHAHTRTDSRVTVVGAGMAGCEAAWALAERGLPVTLIEMKPKARTPAQKSDRFAEMVCSNSLRSSNPANAVGLLKEEMSALGSLIMRFAIHHRVPAGDALAVDREAFGLAITTALEAHPLIKVVCAAVEDLGDSLTAAGGDPTGPVICATGPLTSAPLAEAISAMAGGEGLYFYDALAPIVSTDSLILEHTFPAARWDKGPPSDYLNCPLDATAYAAFTEALRRAESMPLHAFEEARYFNGCLPIEVAAQRGEDALRYGPMKPVGLTDPRTGRWPYAVVQLRREDIHGSAYNLVGFQTKLTYPEQKRVLGLIPALAEARYLRLGAIHRNTYLDAPRLLGAGMQLLAQPRLRFAGQMVGVEGYLESAAHGLLTAMAVAADLTGEAFLPPPATCALGGLYHHVRGSIRQPGRPHEPQNVNWALMPPTPPDVPRAQAKVFRLERARRDAASWRAGRAAPLRVAV